MNTTCTPTVAAVQPLPPALADPNAADAWRADALQWERVAQRINAAMPHYETAFGSDCDHAEAAANRLIKDRDTMLEALRAILELNRYHADAPFAPDVAKICKTADAHATQPQP